MRKYFQNGGSVAKKVTKYLSEIYPRTQFDVGYDSATRTLTITGTGGEPSNWESWVRGIQQSYVDGTVKTTWGDFPA